MTYLTRWNSRSPRRVLAEFDRLFDDMLTMREQVADSPPAWNMAIDVAETEAAYVVEASVPGINPDDIEITLADNTLTITGETNVTNEHEEEKFYLRERRVGRFSRSITLPLQINADAIEANCENGVLTLTVPKAEAVKPQRIIIKSNQKVIEGENQPA